ncbi:uncharacterized protein LOC111674256 [Orussus abietinus]|uniref:uncharacterized protein LOC111674256 n=1 Tax=Orussus abietinus TaxID=222816 RepID=UPI000C7160E6|nr:uncharacterized protein LOC111674256 [Orussus abietinus]
MKDNGVKSSGATTASTSSGTQTASLLAHSKDGNPLDVLLSTAGVLLQDSNGRKHKCRALLDSGSQAHFITETFCQKLELPLSRVETAVHGIGQGHHKMNYRTQVKLYSTCTGFTRTITCLVMSKITEDMPNVSVNASDLQIPANIALTDPYFDHSRPVDLLIGAGLFWDLLCIGQIRIRTGLSVLQKTKLGWIIGGLMTVPRTIFSQRTRCHLATRQQDNNPDITNEELHQDLTKFWELDSGSFRRNPDDLDARDICERHFKATTTRDSTGRFTIRIPFASNLGNLGDSRDMAKKRFSSLEGKFDKHPQLRQMYVVFMREYEDLGHMTEISDEDMQKNNRHYYLPHHAVLKQTSTTTKLRVVFDGSAKTTSGLSLNDVQRVGPTVQDDLFSIILRFRKHTFVISADITKMYRQINVYKAERDFQRIL